MIARPGSFTTRPKTDTSMYRCYVLSVLMLVYVFNTIDRGALSLLVQPIKQELAISDLEVGLLTGTAFAVFYAIMGIPIARYSDRHNRVGVLSSAIFIWSVATALCGLSYNYVSLFICRCITGIGEAGGSPPSHALISAHFPANRRATALAIYAMAVPLGVAIGNILGGWSNVYFGWRVTLVILGLPGVLIALLVWCTIREPKPLDQLPQKAESSASFVGVFRYLCRRSSFLHMALGTGLHSIVWYAGRSWDGAFLVRSHGINTGGAGNLLAAVALIGVLGTLAGGLSADWLSGRRGDKRWYFWVPAFGCLAMIPLHIAAYLTTNVDRAFELLCMVTVLASLFFGPAFAVAQSVAAAGMRAMAAAVLLFIQNMIGYVIGPGLVGALSDYLTPGYGAQALRYSLAAVAVINVWAAAHYLLAARRHRQITSGI